MELLYLVIGGFVIIRVAMIVTAISIVALLVLIVLQTFRQ